MVRARQDASQDVQQSRADALFGAVNTDVRECDAHGARTSCVATHGCEFTAKLLGGAEHEQLFQLHDAKVVLHARTARTRRRRDEALGPMGEQLARPTTGNPFVDVQLSAVLSTGTAAAVTVRGFYDGGGQYRARFMPPTTGSYTYATRSNVAALDGQTGSFDVVAPTPGNHGPVAATPNRTTLSYADGSPHHTIGTTVYGMFGGWGAATTNVTARTLESLRASPFNKVRVMAFPVGAPDSPADLLPYEPTGGTPGAPSDLTRFHLPFWRNVDEIVAALLELDVEADIILFNLYTGSYPKGLACMGGPNASTYDLAPDTLFLQYIIARLAAFRNVWWSMSNEWNQCACKWAGALDPSPCPEQRDFSDPGCGVGGSNSPASHTPVWDALFQIVRAEDHGAHLLSIHNNGYLCATPADSNRPCRLLRSD